MVAIRALVLTGLTVQDSLPQRGRMTDHTPHFTESVDAVATAYAANLLRYYSFELGGSTIDHCLSRWLDAYSANWVRLAVVEALYQGRYKAVSVEQILALWQRRGCPVHHFNHEFERLVCNKLPRNLVPPDALRSPRLFSPKPPQKVTFLSDYRRAAGRVSAEPLAPISPKPVSSKPVSPKPVSPKSSEVPIPSEASVPTVEAPGIPSASSIGHEATWAAELAEDVPRDADEAQPSETVHRMQQLLDRLESLKRSQPTQPETDSLATPLPECTEAAIAAAAPHSLEATHSTVGLLATDPTQPIHQFIPTAESSETDSFYSKLRAVAQPPITAPEQAQAEPEA